MTLGASYLEEISEAELAEVAAASARSHVIVEAGHWARFEQSDKVSAIIESSWARHEPGWTTNIMV